MVISDIVLSPGFEVACFTRVPWKYKQPQTRCSLYRPDGDMKPAGTFRRFGGQKRLAKYMTTEHEPQRFEKGCLYIGLVETPAWDQWIYYTACLISISDYFATWRLAGGHDRSEVKQTACSASLIALCFVVTGQRATTACSRVFLIHVQRSRELRSVARVRMRVRVRVQNPHDIPSLHCSTGLAKAPSVCPVTWKTSQQTWSVYASRGAIRPTPRGLVWIQPSERIVSRRQNPGAWSPATSPPACCRGGGVLLRELQMPLSSHGEGQQRLAVRAAVHLASAPLQTGRGLGAVLAQSISSCFSCSFCVLAILLLHSTVSRALVRQHPVAVLAGHVRRN